MIFNSYVFLLLFLPVTLCIYYAMVLKRGMEAAIVALCICSLVFYSWWDIRNLPLLLASIVGNFILARKISIRKNIWRRRLYLIGVTLNILLLGIFKYAGFVTENLNSFWVAVPTASFVLPLAISFFTFQQISFLRGVYVNTDYVPRFMRYATFISFFPHLIAGPILYHKDIQPQFGSLRREIPYESIALGIALFGIGLFKKVMLADPMGGLADPLFAQAATVSSLDALHAWSAAILYGFQLYFDFSGYSDMAVGLAYLFGIRFPQNFDSPYRATNIAEFWRSWHITLSAFLRDFLYIPLGGNRRGMPRTLINLTLTMGLGGLWHGAGWNFLLWGLVHGVFLAFHAIWQRIGLSLPKPMAWIFTFMAVMAAWVLFRAPDLDCAGRMYTAMAKIPSFGSLADKRDLYHAFGWIAGSLVLCLCLPNSSAWVREGARPFGFGFLAFRCNMSCLVFIVMLFLVAFAHISRQSVFLYFNF